ncbi:hypothetical protein [Marinobacterium weihaiense]|uniref:Uncharacterized protein n=1 Tax=Marinobacterium weihaiense TaxID=2851016 RepID=A0ABS6M6F8_9GAMM|nr:hypothetical protein [Marinobacterium weihaiense]MBV0931857.1 hypothetical protein [Marinobacterium weihaiense]
MRPLHLALGLALLAGFWLTNPFSSPTPPVDAPLVSLSLSPNQPSQRNLDAVATVQIDDYQLKLLAEFTLDARVLGRENYSLGREAELSPWDFALGWGRMSDPDVIEQFKIRQSGRWYYWRSQQLPIPKREVSVSSANMHLIPASDQVREQLEAVGEADKLRFKGFLVEARAEDGWRWRSSLSREDTGNGACELILVTEVL